MKNPLLIGILKFIEKITPKEIARAIIIQINLKDPLS